VHEHAAEKDGIDDAIAGCPVAVFSDDDDGEEHKAEAVVDAAEPAYEAEGIAVADEKGERVTGFRAGEEMSPPVAVGRKVSVLLLRNVSLSGFSCWFIVRFSFLSFKRFSELIFRMHAEVCTMGIVPSDGRICEITHRPPEVGIAEPRSAMARPTIKMNMLARNQPHTNPKYRSTY
jgi:hypothetical protein